MKKISFISMISVAILMIQIAAANDSDPLWIKVIAQHQSSKKWVAKDINDKLSTEKDGEIKQIEQTKQFTKWEKEQAVYAVIKSTDPKFTNKENKPQNDFSAVFDSFDENIFVSNAKVKNRDKQTLNGEVLVVYELEMSGGKASFWIRESSGAIVQRIDEISIPLAAEGKRITQYEVDQAGRNLVTRSLTDFIIKIPFKKAKIKLESVYSNWIGRGESSAG